MAAVAAYSVGVSSWPVIGRAGIPGRIDPADPAGALIFAAGGGELGSDAIARFFASDMARLDWMVDYRMDAEGLVEPEEEGLNFSVEEEPEDDQYDKKALTTTATDSGWDIT